MTMVDLYGQISVQDATSNSPIQNDLCHDPPVFRYFPNPSTPSSTLWANLKLAIGCLWRQIRAYAGSGKAKWELTALVMRAQAINALE